MYRELAPEGVPFGLQKGPYTGPPRQLSLAGLPAPVVSRLAAALAGKGLPEPILRGPQARRLGALAAGGAFAASLVGLGAAAAHGFGQMPGFFQGFDWLAVDGGLGAVAFAAAASQLAGDRRLPRKGTFLLPLDVVEIEGDRLTLTPLGGLRHASLDHHPDGGLALVLRFAHGATHSFPVASEAEGERAFAHLEHAQEQMEALTERLDLARVLDLDPFFPLREAGEWARVPISWRRVGGAVAAVVTGALVGTAVWGVRNAASDHRVYELVAARNDRSGYENYLSAGGRLHTSQAHEALDRLDRQARIAEWEQQAKFAMEAEGVFGDFPLIDAFRPDIEMSPALVEARQHAQERGLAAFRPRARTAAPDVVAMIKNFFEMTRLVGGNELTVEFTRTVEDRAQTPGLAAQLDRDEQTIVLALQRSLGEVFIPSVLLVTDVKQARRKRTQLHIDYEVVTTAARTMNCTFRVTFGAKLAPVPITFVLAMPPPKEPLRTVRDKSLFAVDPAAEASDATQILLARSFDRLYDELYGIFFSGNPRVPATPAQASSHAHSGG